VEVVERNFTIEGNCAHVNMETKYQFKEVVKDTNAQASLIMAGGSVIWKIISIASNVNFLLTVQGETFGVIFRAFESYGWVILMVIGAWLFWVRWDQVKKRGVLEAPSWPMVLSCSIMAFVFGVLIAVRSTGMVPNVVLAWGGGASQCSVVVDGTKLMSFQSNYKVAFACGFTDPRSEKLKDDRITISNSFEIISGAIQMTSALSSEMVTAIPALSKQLPVANIWYEALLLPNGIESQNLKNLSDVLKVGGKIVDPQYFK
jgi:hypothetical protein